MASDLQKVISGISMRVNGIDFKLVGNSAEYNEGLPVRDVMGTDTGEQVMTEDFTQAVGFIKAELYSTDESTANAKIVGKEGIVKVQLIKLDGSFTRTMTQGVCLNGQNAGLGTDGKITLEFKGSPLV